jgi:hypothetical protein
MTGVTADRAPARAADSRNRRQMIEAEIERVVAEPVSDFALQWHGDEDKARAVSLAWLLRETSYRCSRCDRVFEDGDVVHRKRRPVLDGGLFGAGW